jgi:Ca-activated chloride channel family protein
MIRFVLSTLLLSFPVPVAACELALVLAVDVSGSVDRKEYSIQMQGLSAALRDGIVVDALISQSAEITLVQWTGSSRQRQAIPWTPIRSYEDVASLADAIDQSPRVWRNFSTAIGEALSTSLALFDQVPHCARKVIDVSGDGVSNEGIEPRSQHGAARAAGVIINALAIETDPTDLTAYFYENLIVGEGAFVVTAQGFEDYPAQIRRKLQRETTKQLSQLSDAPPNPPDSR